MLLNIFLINFSYIDSLAHYYLTVEIFTVLPKFRFFFKEGIMEKTSYEWHVYESADDTSLS